MTDFETHPVGTADRIAALVKRLDAVKDKAEAHIIDLMAERDRAEARAERLEAELKTVLDRESAAYARHDAKIERLEAALRGYACDCGEVCEACGNDCGLDARAALEGGAA